MLNKSPHWSKYRTEEGAYYCNICRKKYKSHGGMLYHLRRKHNGKA